MTDFHPTEQGAELALRAGRRRRTAKASATGSSALAVAVALVLTTGAGGTAPQPDQLITTTSPTVSAPPSAAPGTTHAPAAGQSAAPQAPAVGPSVFPSPRAAASSPPPAQHRSTAPRRSPITRSSGSIEATDLCSGGQTDSYRTWCARTFDPGEIKRGTTVRLGGELCNYPTSGPLTLDFADTAEVQIAIDPYEDGAKWHSGEGYRYTKPGPTITLAPGECRQWRSPWNTRDAEGFVVPPGSYQLNVYVNTKTQPGYIAWRSLTVVD